MAWPCHVHAVIYSSKYFMAVAKKQHPLQASESLKKGYSLLIVYSNLMFIVAKDEKFLVHK